MTQSALIQGGSGGLGRALVNRILQSNQFDQVVVTGRDIQTIDSRDPRIIPIELDLLSDQSVVDASTAVASQIDKLNLVVTTAGILQNESLGLKPEKKTRRSQSVEFANGVFRELLWTISLVCSAWSFDSSSRANHHCDFVSSSRFHWR